MKKLLLTSLSLFTLSGLNAQSFLAPNYTPEYSESSPTIDLKLYERLITEKQRNYDYNLEGFKQELSACYELLSELKELDIESYNFMKKHIDNWVLKIVKENPDFSSDSRVQILNNTVNFFAKDVRKYIRESQ